MLHCQSLWRSNVTDHWTSNPPHMSAPIRSILHDEHISLTASCAGMEPNNFTLCRLVSGKKHFTIPWGLTQAP